MVDFDETSPGDTDYIADYPANERAERTRVQDWVAEEHYEGTGFHAIGQGDDTARDVAIPSPAAGNIWIRTDIPAIDYYTGAAWVTLQSQILVGEMRMLAFDPTTPPAGWLECNGDAVSRTTYAALFAAIGTNFGVGDGSTTFNLPDMTGKYPVGFDSSAADADYDVIGEEQGANAHALDATEAATLPAYVEADRQTDGPNHTVGRGSGGQTTASQSHDHDFTVNHVHTLDYGAVVAHENRPLSVVIGWVIKT